MASGAADNVNITLPSLQIRGERGSGCRTVGVKSKRLSAGVVLADIQNAVVIRVNFTAAAVGVLIRQVTLQPLDGFSHEVERFLGLSSCLERIVNIELGGQRLGHQDLARIVCAIARADDLLR